MRPNSDNVKLCWVRAVNETLSLACREGASRGGPLKCFTQVQNRGPRDIAMWPIEGVDEMWIQPDGKTQKTVRAKRLLAGGPREENIAARSKS